MKDNIIQFKTFRQVAERPVEDEDLVWQCECGSTDFWLHKSGNVSCAECEELVQLNVVWECEEEEDD